MRTWKLDKGDVDRIKQLLGALFANAPQSELSAPYVFDKDKTVEEEYWAVMALLKAAEARQ